MSSILKVDQVQANSATALTVNDDLVVNETLAVTGVVSAASTIELGHASDTTLARSSAGNMTIEGNLVYRAGGTDVPVTDGGTGASTAAGARTNLDVPSNSEAVLKTIIDAKGDLIVGTAADTPGILTVGSNDKVLTAASGQSAGMSWSEVPLPRSYLAGYGLANNGSDVTNDIDFSVGAARNSTNVINLVAATAMTKQLDAAWAAGTGAGGRMSAAAIANTTYHCYVIRKDSDGTCDFGFDTSATAPTMPTGYTYFRRIGSIMREAGAIVPFNQKGDFFQRKTVVQDVSATSIGTSAVLRTMSVPDGIKVMARILALYRNTSGGADDMTIWLSDPDVNDQPASGSGGVGNAGDGTTIDGRFPRQVDIYTNTSRQVRSRAVNSNASYTLTLITHGWFDTRGRDD